ncbi:coatomer subunit alpha, partial [Cladochytrium tenue]
MATAAPQPDGAADSRCLRTFSGHTNEKNFVGLSVNSTGEFLACGSETNAVYVYSSRLSKPLIVHNFGNPVDSIN